MLSSRKRAALLLGTEPERLGWHLMDALQHLIQPTAIKGIAPCQEAVHRADDPGFDLRRLVPAPTNTPEDAGPYVTMGLLYGKDPDAKALAWAEYVIEGEILPNVRIAEDAQSGNGKAMPEFPGYCGPSDPQTPVMRVTAVTHRLHPIMQTTIGPSEEHVNLAGIPTEASILGLVERAMPGRVRNVYAASVRPPCSRSRPSPNSSMSSSWMTTWTLST